MYYKNTQQILPHLKSTLPLSLGCMVMSLLLGCSTTGSDPWKGWNQGSQAFNDGLDKGLIKPIAQGYEWLTPEPVDKGVTNFFSNINDVGVTINDLLQFKILQGGQDLSRFLVNTTVGVGGVMDIAKDIDLPKHHEDFGQTLGVWGVPSGPYLVLPIFGPSSPRETVGLMGDAMLNPLTYVSFIGGAASAATAGSKVVDIADTRADLIPAEKIVNEAASDKDRYEFIKNAYQQRRDYLLNDGKVSEDDTLDIESELDATPSRGSQSSSNLNQLSSKPLTPVNSAIPQKNATSGHLLKLSDPE